MQLAQPHQIYKKLGQLNWSFWLSFSFFVLVLIYSLYFSMQFWQWLKTKDNLPIEQLILEGNHNYVQYQDILAALEPEMQNSFFGLNVNKAQQRLSHVDWVHSVVVRKEWPNIIKVNLIEQQPRMFWNGDFLLNHLIQVFQADTSRLQQSLPSIFGPEGDEKLAAKAHSDLSQLLHLQNMSITELILSERHAISMTLNNGIQLNLGREDWVMRTKRFVDNYPKLAKKAQINYVDLRYDIGFAIGLKPDLINNTTNNDKS